MKIWYQTYLEYKYMIRQCVTGVVMDFFYLLLNIKSSTIWQTKCFQKNDKVTPKYSMWMW